MKKIKVKPTVCKPVTSFKINRSKWLCGELYWREERANKVDSESVLLDTSGRMCCLGFYAKACGVPSDKLLNLPDYSYMNNVSALPSTLIDRCNTDPRHDSNTNTDTAESLLHTNDAVGYAAGAREKEIAKLFKKAGISVSFIGKYPRVIKDD